MVVVLVVIPLIVLALAAGAAFVSVRNSTHYGPASPYALMALPHQMIGISMTTGALLIAPPGFDPPG